MKTTIILCILFGLLVCTAYSRSYYLPQHAPKVYAKGHTCNYHPNDYEIISADGHKHKWELINNMKNKPVYVCQVPCCAWATTGSVSIENIRIKNEYGGQNDSTQKGKL